MNDEDRAAINWSVRYVDRGERDDMGYVIPRGWWVAGFEDGVEDSIASVHVAQHHLGPHAAASLAAIVSHLLNTHERERVADLAKENEK